MEAVREGADGVYVDIDVRTGANVTRCSFLETLLGPNVRVLVVRGSTSRRKTVLVAGCTRDRVAEVLLAERS